MKHPVLIFTFIVAAAASALAAERPNIIFILADDLGCMDVGAVMPTPNPEFDPKKKKQK